MWTPCRSCGIGGASGTWSASQLEREREPMAAESAAMPRREAPIGREPLVVDRSLPERDRALPADVAGVELMEWDWYTVR